MIKTNIKSIKKNQVTRRAGFGTKIVENSRFYAACGVSQLSKENRKTVRSCRSSSLHIISRAKRCCGHVCPCSHHAYRGHGGMEDRGDKVDN